MSAVAYRDLDLRRVSLLDEPSRAPAHPRKGIFRRIFAAIARWQRRSTEHEAGRFIANHGGRLTDDVERQLAEHFSGRAFPPFKPPRAFRPFPSL